MPAAYGWRGRVGKLNPTVVASTFVYEFYKVAPPGIMLLTRNLAVRDVRNPADLKAAVGLMEEAVQDLKRAGADVILGAGIPVLLAGGRESNREIVDLLAQLSGLPVTTTLSAALDAFRRLGVSRLAVATAYGKAELGEQLADFLRANGLEVAGLSTIETGLASIEKPKLDFGFVYRYGKGVFLGADRPEALYFPSSAWPTVEYVEYLERDLGAPVVSSASAAIWKSLDLLGIREPIRGYGRLLGSL